jgi:flagellar motility protein MotE (MotC chaperone)
VKGRIALFAGYFVGMLVLASWLTGLVQEGVLPRLRRSPAAHSPEAPPPQPRVERAGAEPPRDQVRGQAESMAASELEAVNKALADKRAQLAELEEQVRQQKEQALIEEKRLAEMKASSAPPRDQARGQAESMAASELDAINKALAARRTQLAQLGERARQQKEHALIEEKRLAEMEASNTKLAKERDARREAGIRKLAKLYESMEPEAAASILGALEKGLATEVLATMRERQASKVLQAMDGKRASELSERLQAVGPARSNGSETM